MLSYPRMEDGPPDHVWNGAPQRGVCNFQPDSCAAGLLAPYDRTDRIDDRLSFHHFTIAYKSICESRRPPVVITNTESIAGHNIVRVLGLVQGNTVRAKHAGRDIAASFKNLVGGELRGYTELLTESRREAVERMMAQAQQLGANAIVNVRFTTSAVTAGAAEMYAYGTAVVVSTP